MSLITLTFSKASLMIYGPKMDDSPTSNHPTQWTLQILIKKVSELSKFRLENSCHESNIYHHTYRIAHNM